MKVFFRFLFGCLLCVSNHDTYVAVAMITYALFWSGSPCVGGLVVPSFSQFVTTPRKQHIHLTHQLKRTITAQETNTITMGFQ